MAKDKALIDRHVRQWLHNRSLIHQIPPSHPDWVVTVVFYTAVHAVDAALAFEEVNTWNHDTRFKALAGVHRLSKVRTLYHTLYDLSRKVRYSGDPNLWIAPADIKSKVIRGHLVPLEQSVQFLIGQDLKLTELDLFQINPIK